MKDNFQEDPNYMGVSEDELINQDNSKEFIHVNELEERTVAYLLLKYHSMGGFRDESDLNISKHHANETLLIIKDILELDGSNEDKLEFIKKLQDEIPKFKAKLI